MKNASIIVSSLEKKFYPGFSAGTIKTLLLDYAKGKKNKKRQGHKVISGIDLEVGKGEFLGVVGRNGSGKTTLLKLLAGVYSPDKGSVKVNGTLTPFIELGVGFNPELSGRSNIYLNSALLGFSRKSVDSMYKDIIEFAELEDFMDQKLKNYSSGMQVRLAFSIAIKVNSDILLIDEVLAVGDAKFQKKCYDMFESFKELGKSVVFVSHSMAQVKRFCDRVIVIDKGKKIFDGNTDSAVRIYEELNQPKTKKENQEEKIDISNIKESYRSGSGRAKISNISLKTNHIVSGRQLDLSLDIRIKDEHIVNLYVVVSIYKDGCRDSVIALSEKINVKNQMINIRIPELNLIPGSYNISVGLTRAADMWDGHYDLLEKTSKFTVTSTAKNIHNSLGQVVVDYKVIQDACR